MKANHWVLAAIVVGISCGSGLRAGDLTPPGAPGPTMHTLEEIYQQLLATQRQVADLKERMSADGKQVTSGAMVLIPAGSFKMGATTNVGHEIISDAVPQHAVTLSAFYMDKCEVSGDLWQAVRTWATNNGYAFSSIATGKGGSYPVQSIFPSTAFAWCNARSVRDGFTPCYTNGDGTAFTNSMVEFAGGCNWSANGYRLPTEAEWEKAARGGESDRRFPWEDANTIQHARANYNASPSLYGYDTSPTTDYHPSYTNLPAPFTSPVGSFPANRYGVHDMAGNVWEWCWDWYDASYYSSSPGTNPTGPAVGSPLLGRVLRGGAWDCHAFCARCANRHIFDSAGETGEFGFRCVRGL